MKRYHAMGILISATVIFASACSLAIEPDRRPSICPVATAENSSYVATDEDEDGEVDTIWHIYTAGICAGFTVEIDDNGIPL